MRGIGRIGAVAVLLAALGAPASASECSVGDLNGDNVVNVLDLIDLLLCFGLPADPPCDTGDTNADGVINVLDLITLLLNFGSTTVAGGTFPATWINGGPNCPTEPAIQVHAYNADTYILRQSLCTNFEGPFIYLLFGQDKVLMQDTGAGGIAIASTVYGIIDTWLADHQQESIELIVSHSHAHGDHIAGDSQFNGQPDTTMVGLSSTAVASFFGISAWPTDIVEYDLGGGRIIDVIPIPGHQSAHIALYDRQTGLLLTGDTLYPGRLYISNFTQYIQSIRRLNDFIADKTVCHVLGTHIEMSNTPGDDYAFGATSHPDEHPLPLERSHLQELYDALLGMEAAPHIEVHDDFIVWPL